MKSFCVFAISLQAVLIYAAIPWGIRALVQQGNLALFAVLAVLIFVAATLLIACLVAQAIEGT